MIQAAILAALPAGGGPAPYHADAVHFDGATFFDIASLSSSDSGKFLMVGFIKMDVSQAFSTVFPLCDFRPATNEWGFAIQTDGTMVITMGDGSNRAGYTSDPGVFPFDTNWHSIIVSGDTDQPDGSKRFAIYLDRVRVSGPIGDGVPAFVVPFSGIEIGVPDTFGDEPTIVIEDAANIMIWCGVGVVAADQTISLSDLNNFTTTSNKPVDPTTAIAAYGTPAIACIGDASTFGTNQGTGGAFTATGTLTNSSTSPSD